MATAPGTHDITVQRRADYEMPLVFKDNSDAAINLTGWTVAAQLWNESRATKHADWTVTYTNRAAGSIKIALTDTQTASLPFEELKYDVMLTNQAGLKEYYLEGTVFVDEGYTA